MRFKLSVLLAFAVPLAGLATTMPTLPLWQRVQRADRVVLAQVLKTETVVQGDDPRTMRTLTTIVVGETLKGPKSGPQQLTIAQLGGRWGLWESHIPGDATLVKGETAVLLLHCGDRTVCALDGLGEGHIKLEGHEALLYQVTGNLTRRQPTAEVLAEIARAVALPLPGQPTPAPTTGGRR